MNEIIIIKKAHGDMGHFGHEAMANTVCICDCILDGKVDGDKVKATIEGTLMEHDGKRYISIDTVDGESVEDPEMPMDDDGDEGEMDNGSMPGHAMMDSEDALSNFMKQYKGK